MLLRRERYQWGKWGLLFAYTKPGSVKFYQRSYVVTHVICESHKILSTVRSMTAVFMKVTWCAGVTYERFCKAVS